MVGKGTRVLIKVFAKGFYKAHSGLLLFLFVVIFSHCFWMKPLGGHLTHEESIFYHLIMMLSFANDPVMMVLVFVTWTIYTLKSWDYVQKQVKEQEHMFLFYSITSMNLVDQFGSWFLVQMIILLPAILYGSFAIVIGAIYHYYLIPAFIPFYLIFLISISAFVYVFVMNRLDSNKRENYVSWLSRKWPKPFFSLFPYYVLDKLKLGYVLTKMLSWLTILGISLYYSDLKGDNRLAEITVLIVVVGHSYLIFQAHRFEDIYMSFSRNFPVRRPFLFLGYIAGFMILILPESIWILTRFNPWVVMKLLIFILSTALLFRSLLFAFGLKMYQYLRWVFALLILFFLVIVFGGLRFLLPFNLFFAYWIFYKKYYTYEGLRD